MFAEKLKHEPLKKIQKRIQTGYEKKDRVYRNEKGYENGIQTIIPVSENGFIRIWM